MWRVRVAVTSSTAAARIPSRPSDVRHLYVIGGVSTAPPFHPTRALTDDHKRRGSSGGTESWRGGQTKSVEGAARIMPKKDKRLPYREPTPLLAAKAVTCIAADNLR